jgi:hypothetical protein
MSENEWVTLLEVYDRLEAEILKEALEARGIPAQLFQEGLSHFIYPVGGRMGRIEICVPHNRKQDAINWLEAYNNGELQSDSNNPNEPDSE